jgi:hypothetical protein
MKRIEVKLSLLVVAPLLDVIKGLADDINREPATARPPADLDGEFRDDWSRDLLGDQQSDVAVLLALFGENFFLDGIVSFDQTNAEAIARACSAVRLLLRERFLKPVADDTLESGEVELAQLDPQVQKAFMCYLFLATIQELIIQHLDESIIGLPGGDSGPGTGI